MPWGQPRECYLLYIRMHEGLLDVEGVKRLARQHAVANSPAAAAAAATMLVGDWGVGGNNEVSHADRLCASASNNSLAFTLHVYDVHRRPVQIAT